MLPASSCPLTPTGFFNGMLAVFEPGALSCYTFFCPILLVLSVSRNPILTHLSLFGSLDSLLCDLIAPPPGLAFFLLMPRTLVATSTFSLGRASSFSELSTYYLSSLDPYSDCTRVNISLNNSSSLSFLNVYTPPICFSPMDGRTDSFPPEISSFWGTSIDISPSGTQEVLPTPLGRKYLIGLSLLISFPSMTLTFLLFSITPPLTFPLLPPLLHLEGASGPGF